MNPDPLKKIPNKPSQEPLLGSSKEPYRSSGTSTQPPRVCKLVLVSLRVPLPSAREQ